jgi:hypothetical protein
MGTGLREAKKDGHTYLERLGIPVLHFHDGLHGTKIVRQLVEFFDPVGKSNRELLYKKQIKSVSLQRRGFLQALPARNWLALSKVP